MSAAPDHLDYDRLDREHDAEMLIASGDIICPVCRTCPTFEDTDGFMYCAEGCGWTNKPDEE